MDPDPEVGPHIKLVDFGFSVNTENKDAAGMKIALGARLYMAPELINGAGEVHTPAIDIWAVGVLAFYLITYGLFPFPGIAKEAVSNKILTEEPELYRIADTNGD